MRVLYLLENHRPGHSSRVEGKLVPSPDVSCGTGDHAEGSCSPAPCLTPTCLSPAPAVSLSSERGWPHPLAFRFVAIPSRESASSPLPAQLNMEKYATEKIIGGFIQVRALLISAEDSGKNGLSLSCSTADTGGIQMRL